ncbi:T9SS type A sorting domain-containing protein [Sporocytophaga myxococcoides]|uniref:T9SS type A sorting domain-containing protein n=1 Tax=Sporocytophaga myxococcoides TaxID=153721 RepID=UPI000422F366|nr:T9SS type A sorting domain-containing protein [Sporocytophaga myxococcoides]
MKKILRKPLLVVTMLFATLFTEAQVATRLQFPNPNQHVYFGSSVTEFNGHSIIGTEFRDRIHLFQNATHKFEAVGPQYSGFGYAHSMSSNWIVVGAPKINSYTGTVYLAKSVNGQYQNNFNTILTAHTPGQYDEFGRALDVHNNWLVIGAPNTYNTSHGGYIEVWKESGSSWVRSQKITPSGLPADADFGYSVAIRGDRMVVGAPGIKKVYIYKQVNDVWVQEQIYQPNLPAWGQPATDAWGNTVYLSRFGYDVDITDGLLIVGDPEARKAAILTRNGSVWQLTNTLNPPASAGPYNSDQFGYSVAIQFNRAVVGAPYPAQGGVRPNEGKVYLYTDGYQFKGHLYIGNNASLSVSGLGYSVAIDSDNVLGGAPYTNNVSTNVPSEGAVFRLPFYYVYQSGSWRTLTEAEDGMDASTSSISLYPNPVNGEVVNVKSSETIVSVEAVSAAGAVKSLGVSENMVDVSALENGVYALKIKTASGVKVEKLVKE